MTQHQIIISDDEMLDELARRISPLTKADVESMKLLTQMLQKHIENMHSMIETFVQCVRKLEEAGVFKKPKPPDDDDDFGPIN
jgi:hypothetical protein